jgi:hypothetical protein
MVPVRRGQLACGRNGAIKTEGATLGNLVGGPGHSKPGLDCSCGPDPFNSFLLFQSFPNIKLIPTYKI